MSEPIPPVVLASSSATRAALLERAGVPFVVAPAAVDESEIKLSLQAEGATAADCAEALAELKALKRSYAAPGALVIGADQMLSCEGRWFDKPVDRAAAREQLLALAGRQHVLDSAVVVAKDGSAIWRHREAARLTMRPFDAAFVDGYLDQAGDVVTTSVGGYQIEGLGAQLFQRIAGDYFCILGLPLLPLLELLRNHRVLAR
jgi:septum formation protein